MQAAKPDSTLTPAADLMAIDALLAANFANKIMHLVNRDAHGLNLLKRGTELQYVAYRANTRPMILGSYTLHALAKDCKPTNKGGYRKKKALTANTHV